MLRILLLAVLLLTSVEAGAAQLIALSYHNVQVKLDDPEGMAVTQDRLIGQFSWLREHGFQPVSVEDLLAAREGRKILPEKAVLLTFDDGYRSFHSIVLPLLKAYSYPAVLALVGSWLDAPAGSTVLYGDQPVAREHFLDWEQLREIAASGLVEIASHSYDLHRGVPANPQGNQQPVTTARIYDAVSGRYEDEAAYRERLRADFVANAELLKNRLGVSPRVMVWPYGEYNGIAVELAKSAGMSLSLSLGGAVNKRIDGPVIDRMLILGNPNLADFVWQMRNLQPPRPAPRRVLHVDLDYVYDADPQQQERNLGLLLDRVQTLGVNTVYLQAFADPDGDGVAQALYFPNRHLPMRADLFNRAAWQLRTRTGVEVFAWMPVLAFGLGGPDELVQALQADGSSAPSPASYRRLSPFSPQARQWVEEIYADLATHAVFSGLLFHDDALLSDFEDSGPTARAAYRAAGLPDDISQLRSDPVLQARWTRLKSQALLDFTDRLAAVARQYRLPLKTARNLYARPVLQPASEAWYAQNLGDFVARYDQVAVMAMPYMEQAADPELWLEQLVRQANLVPGAVEKMVFELQSVDWRRQNEPIPAATLVRQLQLLQLAGVRHFGYYPDNFFQDQPQAEILRGEMSLQSYPYRP
jgi:biofilm PGA synthesis lipoprotein PgaB